MPDNISFIYLFNIERMQSETVSVLSSWEMSWRQRDPFGGEVDS